MANRMSLIIFSGTADKLTAAATLASGGVIMGMEVQIFCTFWGLMAFRKGAWQDPAQQKISAEFTEFASTMQEAMAKKGVAPWMKTLSDAKELGDLKVYACGNTLDMFDIKPEDLEEIVDGVKGVAGFISEAQDSKITLFI